MTLLLSRSEKWHFDVIFNRTTWGQDPQIFAFKKSQKVLSRYCSKNQNNSQVCERTGKFWTFLKIKYIQGAISYKMGSNTAVKWAHDPEICRSNIRLHVPPVTFTVLLFTSHLCCRPRFLFCPFLWHIKMHRPQNTFFFFCRQRLWQYSSCVLQRQTISRITPEWSGT